ncbi:MAG: histidine phosphatase family protein [Armatimonadetes bacterium]|nr:histidine phosphatase family protein [Armatimonadota bacterium]
MRLLIIRHADPDYANNTITEYGHREAEALARQLQAEGVDRMYCSPLGRAIHTMRYSADLLKMEAVIEDWTQELSGLEVDGEWGRIGLWDLPGEVYRAGEAHPAFDTWRRMPPLDEARVGETMDRLARSSDAFLARHGYAREGRRYRVVRSSRERVAVFCHGAFGLAWVAHLLEIPLPLVWAGFWLPPSSVTTILMEERSPHWAIPRCIGLGDVSHLYAAGLPTRPRGLFALNQ